MPEAPAIINNASTAIGSPCAGTAQQGDANTFCPDVFTISGNLVTNLVQGENVMAASAHNLASGNDLVFGCALLKNTTRTGAPTLQYEPMGDVLMLFWNGEGYVLQESTDLGSSANWTDQPSATNPFYVTNGVASFYRLRN
jgi:hypothetical protein